MCSTELVSRLDGSAAMSECSNMPVFHCAGAIRDPIDAK